MIGVQGRSATMSMSISGMHGSYAPQAMSGASARAAPSQKMANLFSQIDTTRSGSITQSQFAQAFNALNPPAGFKAMGASAVFSALDPNNTGSVSRQNFIQGMTSLMAQFRSANSSSAG
jgi:Ca2+-binding EF-hand superfamily protein